MEDESYGWKAHRLLVCMLSDSRTSVAVIRDDAVYRVTIVLMGGGPVRIVV